MGFNLSSLPDCCSAYLNYQKTMDHKLVRGVSLKLSFHSWFVLEYRPRQLVF